MRKGPFLGHCWDVLHRRVIRAHREGSETVAAVNALAEFGIAIDQTTAFTTQFLIAFSQGTNVFASGAATFVFGVILALRVTRDLPLATQRRVESIASDRSPFAVA
jgi:hypothetical protein